MTVVLEAEPSGAPADPAVMPLERVEAELCTLAGQIAAATSRFLHLLADFDSRDGWAGTGVMSCAHWLSWRCGLDLHTAREHVRTARRLQQLPLTSAAFAQGRISYSKVRAIVRVATPDNEYDLVDAALHSPAGQLSRLVGGLKKAKGANDDEDARRRGGAGNSGSTGQRPGVQWRWDDDGSLKIWGRLSADDGARLLAGLTRMDHELRRTDTDADADDGGDTASVTPAPCGELGAAAPSCAQGESLEAKSGGSKPTHLGVAGKAPSDLAAALVAVAELACTAVPAPVHAPAADVVVHVDAETLVKTARHASQGADEGPHARLDDGPPLLHTTLARLACDGRIQLSVDGPDGRTLDLGRRRRYPNQQQLRALWRRDRGCAHPGCARTRFLHAHHVTAWATGGRTDLDNLILLCGEHHRELHDGGFTIIALGRQQFRFHGPHGAERPAAPRVWGSLSQLTAAQTEITPTTIEPDWDGAPLHLAHATDVYLTRWANERARRAATTAGTPDGAHRWR